MCMTVEKETCAVHRNSEGMEAKRRRIAEKARKGPECMFSSLFQLMDMELLKGCFEGLRKDAASGINRVTHIGGQDGPNGYPGHSRNIEYLQITNR